LKFPRVLRGDHTSSRTTWTSSANGFGFEVRAGRLKAAPLATRDEDPARLEKEGFIGGGKFMNAELRTGSRKFDGYRGTPVRMARGRCLAVLTLACALDLAAGNAVLAGGDVGSKTQPSPATAAAGPTMNDANFWVGRNISTVVKVFGQATYWNANHDGGGGGNRYIYSNPGQPHFVFETQPGQTIVNAVRIP